jgi:hypothetical protein
MRQVTSWSAFFSCCQGKPPMELSPPDTTTEGVFSAQEVSNPIRFTIGILVSSLSGSRSLASSDRHSTIRFDCLVLARPRPKTAPSAFRRRAAALRPLPPDFGSICHQVQHRCGQNNFTIEPAGGACVRSDEASH